MNTNSTAAQQPPLPRWYITTQRSFLACGILSLVLCIGIAWYLLDRVSSDLHAGHALFIALTLPRLFGFFCIIVGGIFGLIDLWLWWKPSNFADHAQLFSLPVQFRSEQTPQVPQTNIGNLPPLLPETQGPYLVSGSMGSRIQQPEIGQGSYKSTPAPMQTNPRGTSSGGPLPAPGKEGQSIQPASQTAPALALPPTMEPLMPTENQAAPGSFLNRPAIDEATLPLVPGESKMSISQEFRFFRIPREGDNLERSADKLAFNLRRDRYAVADGVGTSFLPGKWAQIVTDRYVKRAHKFVNDDDVVQWLQGCSDEWHNWVMEEWVPRAVSESGQRDWSREIARGAATTFVGCSISQDEYAQQGFATVRVYVVGDTEFFLVTPPETSQDLWKEIHYRLELKDFGQQTETFATPAERVQRDYKWLHYKKFSARRDDYIVLATDALAQWILRQIEAQKDPWELLFSISNDDDFKSFVMACRRQGEMEVDDTTVMVIPLSSSSSVIS